jgi:hypothetical protein
VVARNTGGVSRVYGDMRRRWGLRRGGFTDRIQQLGQLERHLEGDALEYALVAVRQWDDGWRDEGVSGVRGQSCSCRCESRRSVEVWVKEVATNGCELREGTPRAGILR